MLTLGDIQAAKARIAGRVDETPLSRDEVLRQRSGASDVFCKLENLQRTGSFKVRGAFNKLLLLSEPERAKGVIGASAGNHAQGLAYAAGILGIQATIVMPVRSPLIKISNTRGFGARVILKGDNYDDAYQEALAVQAREGSLLVHAFNDPTVIAGQGTLGLELIEQMPDVDIVVIPVGGGGVAVGTALAVKSARPQVRVFGVQTAAVPSLRRALEAGTPVEVPAASTLADGIAIRRTGEHTLELAKRYIDDILTVDDEDIASAILHLLEREKTVAEGAGAAAVAALLHDKVPNVRGKRVVAVLTGGNIDVNLVSRIIERGLVRDGRRVRLTVTVPDRPGLLARFTAALAEQGGNVIEIHHERASSRTPLGDVEIQVTLETRGRSHVDEIQEALSQKGLIVREEK
ncbi:MAG: threonine ammonia-lyase [Myxococcaceae bacterium]